MIELPEAIAFSKQINETLVGKRIRYALRGQNPHKFAFPQKGTEQLGAEYSDADFDRILKGRTITKSWSNGNVILMQMDADYLLSLGCGGEKIIYHETERTLPKKHQLLLTFEDNTFLSVTISGWGEVRLFKIGDLDKHPNIGYDRINPLSDEFTSEVFEKLIEEIPENRNRNAKRFFISEPGFRGVGNGVIQDIFFLAKIHPKREMSSLSKEERKRLYETTRVELQKMVDLGGRDSEKDLLDNWGGYKRRLHSKVVNEPCPVCETPIVKEQFGGGSIYFCPSCQKAR
ncbi:MAG: endonuclease VIII [Candidatus Bathyarchaeota archaeon]|nr:MAG: endonuclease VIII [Candidatus Bathyarchaeota archaeon]